MNYRLPCLCVIILILLCQSSESIETQFSYYKTFLPGVHKFSTHFYKIAAQNNYGNFICSPVSALTLLAALANGADGKSREELVQASHLPITEDIILQNFRQFSRNLNSVPGIELHLANGLFVKKEINIHQTFRNMTNDVFQSKVENIDFEVAQAAVETINKWSKDETMNRITNIMKSEDIIGAVMLMMNAAYFQGIWAHSFGSNLINEKFYLSESDVVTVPMMCNIFPYNYGPILNSSALYIDIPFKTQDSEREFSMLIILPREINGLEEIGERLDEINFFNLNEQVERENVRLCLPKFKIGSELDLIPTLKNMGIKDIFTHRANFSNIASNHDLKVSEAIHKAFFSVDERGTEPAIISVLAMKGPGTPSSLFVDRSFIAAIIWKTTGAPLFWARINDPRSQLNNNK